jgi:hypothetical protein
MIDPIKAQQHAQPFVPYFVTDEEQLKILRQGVAAWNEWRSRNPNIEVNLIRAGLGEVNLSGANLGEAILGGANLTRANLSGAMLGEANLSSADLTGANLTGAFLLGAHAIGANLTGAILTKALLAGASLSGANLTGANLSGANLTRADLSRTDLSGAILSGANLNEAHLVETDLCDATLTGSSVYGASVWKIKVDERTKQQNLVITDRGEPVITVDNIKVAQFIYLLLNNQEIRYVIDTVGRKLVLILGRFTPERKRVLDALRNELRGQNYLPVVFDFEKPASRDLTETISTLAHMARFVIADLTEAKSLPQELQAIVPNLPSVPVQPIILRGAPEYAMFEHFRHYPWVLEVLEYDDAQVIGALAEQVVASLQAKGR